jgi:hypothetical protein
MMSVVSNNAGKYMNVTGKNGKISKQQPNPNLCSKIIKRKERKGKYLHICIAKALYRLVPILYAQHNQTITAAFKPTGSRTDSQWVVAGSASSDKGTLPIFAVSFREYTNTKLCLVFAHSINNLFVANSMGDLIALDGLFRP